MGWGFCVIQRNTGFEDIVPGEHRVIVTSVLDIMHRDIVFQ